MTRTAVANRRSLRRSAASMPAMLAIAAGLGVGGGLPSVIVLLAAGAGAGYSLSGSV